MGFGDWLSDLFGRLFGSSLDSELVRIENNINKLEVNVSGATTHNDCSVAFHVYKNLITELEPIMKKNADVSLEQKLKRKDLKVRLEKLYKEIKNKDKKLKK